MMKRTLLVVGLLALTASPVWAQRGSIHFSTGSAGRAGYTGQMTPVYTGQSAPYTGRTTPAYTGQSTPYTGRPSAQAVVSSWRRASQVHGPSYGRAGTRTRVGSRTSGSPSGRSSRTGTASSTLRAARRNSGPA